jgi:transcriptional regulator with XRE-family HTH domain
MAQFLRSRRERLSPADAGIRATGRRRTPGLRREEVATLAGVSIDYLVRLEQGRDTNPSAEVVAALAEALQLDGDESRHLLALAARSASPHLEQFCPATPRLDAEVPATVQLILDQLDPTPAFVIGPLGDVVASNATWRTIAAPLGLIELPNLVRHLFLHPDARTIYPDWDRTADAQVARFRTAHRQLEQEPTFQAVLAELLAVPEFADRWAAHPVALEHRGSGRLHHPEAGELRLAFEVLRLADDDQELVTWLPDDDATADAIHRLAATEQPVSPAQLRVVGRP